MGIIKGLGKINAYNEELERRKEAANAPKTDWFGLKDRETVLVRFLQELDGDSPKYSSKNDLGFIAVEHSSPADFRKKALCTADEGQCYACEEHRRKNMERDPEYKGAWKPKSRLYINALVRKAGEDDKVVVLSQGTSAKQITPALLEAAGEYGSITDRWFKITRTGAGLSDTSYTLTPRDRDDDVKVEDYELFDLDTVVRSVAYEDQEAHYGATVTATRTESAPRAAATADDEW